MSVSGETPYDLVIVGSGFGGSILAMIACRLGLSVFLVERGQHPRFAIGESTSPLTNLLIEEFALRYHLPRLLPLATYGAWKGNYPDIVCGLKRGFTYYEQVAGVPPPDCFSREQQLLVAASPSDRVADTHWLRSDVDQFFLQEAIAAGTIYTDRTVLHPPVFRDDGTIALTGERGPEKRPLSVQCRLLIDATGPRGYLGNALSLRESCFANYPATQALFSHFTGVRGCGDIPRYQTPGSPPYPVDAAALHHVFEGGWMWVLRFDNGVTSAGIAVTDALAAELRLGEGETAWYRFLDRLPAVREQFADAKPLFPLTFMPRLTYRAETATGPGWALLPSAAAFIDPLFSNGFPLTLLGIERLARILETSWGSKDFQARLDDYGKTTLEEVDAAAEYIGGCYAAFPRFRLFTAFSMFYFAAASYSEVARRVGKSSLVNRYLATSHPTFGPAMRAGAAWLREHARTATEEEIACFERRVQEGIACLNIAGLADLAKANWYDVDLQDLIRNAEKVGLTPDTMRAILATAEWARS